MRKVKYVFTDGTSTYSYGEAIASGKKYAVEMEEIREHVPTAKTKELAEKRIKALQGRK